MFDYSDYFVNLYKNVFEKERKKFKVKDESIINAIRVMKNAYLPDPFWTSKSISDLSATNYDDPAFRCAYLHKYAMCYSGMVCHLLQLALDQTEIYDNFIGMQKVYLCSLGGGPGTDIVGVLAALASKRINIDSWSASIVDLAGDWNITFSSILSELGSDDTPLRSMAKKELFADLVKVNLLEDWDIQPLTEQSIRMADVVLMVKFISAAACNKTDRMIQKVFHCLKPEAMVIFIDNAAGGFDKIVKKNTLAARLVSIYGPLSHYDYENSKFDKYGFGTKSQSKSRVFFEVYQKQRDSSIHLQSEHELFAQAGIEHAQCYEETSTQRYVRHRKIPRQQIVDDDGTRPCDLFISFVLMLIIGIVIKLYIEV